MTVAVFLSYRRGTASGSAGRLYDALVSHFGENSIFMDVDSIQPGDDFVEVIDETLAGCLAVVVVIDPEWISARDRNGRLRLEDPRDFVRLEIESALRHGIRVLPVLVDGAFMPGEDELPRSIGALATRHALEISPTRFRYDAGRLIEAIERIMNRTAAAPAVPGGSQEGPRGAAEQLPIGVPAGLTRGFELTTPPINAPAQLVWDLMVDIERYPLEAPRVASIEPRTSGPMRKGYRYEQVMKVMSIPVRFEVEVTEFDPPHRFSLTHVDANDAKSWGVTHYTLMDNGATTSVHTVSYMTASPVVTLDRVISKRAERRWLAAVAAAAEAEQARRTS